MIIRLLLLIHLAGVSIFLGNITATLVWKIYADRSRDLNVIRHMLQTAIRADKVVTVPGVVVVTISGVLLIIQEGTFLLSQLWLQLSIALWVTSAAAAVGYLVPSLKRLSGLAEETAVAEDLNSGYYTKAKRWNVASLLLILVPLVILALMVMKPFL